LGRWEDHAHLLAQAQQVGAGSVDVLVVDPHRSLDAHAFDQVVHAVEHPQQRALAAAAGADQGGHLARRDLQVDGDQGLEIAVEKVKAPGLDAEVAHAHPNLPVM